MNINGTRILRLSSAQVLRIGQVFADLKALFVVLLGKCKVRKLENRHAKGYAKAPTRMKGLNCGKMSKFGNDA